MDGKLSISDKLSELRKEKNLTMKDVADGIGMKADSYRNYERGRLQPSIDTVVKLADFFNVTTDYLLGREPASNPIDQLSDSEMEKIMLEVYFQLPKPVRGQIMEMMYKAALKNMEKKKQASLSESENA